MLGLSWMRPDAPYMPVAVAGLLAVTERQEAGVTAEWAMSLHGPVLRLAASCSVDELGEMIASAPWPDLEAVAWPGAGPKQGLKPTLADSQDPLGAYRAMVSALHRSTEEAIPIELALLRAIVSDGGLDAAGVPMRSRLLRGVKADLSSVGKPPKVKAEELARELDAGPQFRRGSSGLGLGFVPEIQTFGGTTGPEPSSVGSYSPLLYNLLWHGIIALPPVTVARGRQRGVGGPLVTAPDVLSWPQWSIAVDLRCLRSLFALADLHEDVPSIGSLSARGIDAVYRARAVPINSMVAVFRWGRRVA